MKICLITDTHFGARNSSPVFDAYFEKFYKDCFFPELQKRGVDTIVHLGDCFDHRRFINFGALKSCKRYFFDKIRDFGLNMHVIAGNHDCYLKNTNEVNSVDLLLPEYDCIKSYSEHQVVDFGGTPILLMPWICSSNYNDSIEALETAKTDIVFGHFEIAGFQMYKGAMNEHGFSKAIFDRYDIVYSGHFHHRSSDSNISYLGTPYEIVWSDSGDPKGFHIFDTETRELEFIENPFTIFEKYYYDDTKEDADQIPSSHFEGKLVKVIAVHKTDVNKFENFIERINKKNPVDLKVVEDYSEFELTAIDDENLNVEDTFSIIENYIDSAETDLNRDRLKDCMKTLYIETVHSVC